MKAKSMRNTLLCSAAVALGMAISPPMLAAEATHAAPPPPIVVAQAPGSTAARGTPVADAPFPAYERGVREAAAEGNGALRRYVWRTRMIYGFYYNDFARKE